MEKAKLLEKIRYAFYWPNMRKIIRQMCARCDKCTVRKPPLRKNRAPLTQYIVGAPMERIAIDIMGPLPKSRRGNAYVLSHWGLLHKVDGGIPSS